MDDNQKIEFQTPDEKHALNEVVYTRNAVPNSLFSNLLHRRDTFVGYTAWHDIVEIPHVRTDIER